MAELMTLQDALVDEIRDLYDAEKQLVKAMPTMASHASNGDLRNAIESHLQETKRHVERLEQGLQLLGQPLKGKRCAGIAGIIEEAAEATSQDADAAVLDAIIIASAQRAEHYEIAAYGTSVAWAEALDLRDLAHLLRQNLNEEKAADDALTSLAEHGINSSAIDAAGDHEPNRAAAAKRSEAAGELSTSDHLSPARSRTR